MMRRTIRAGCLMSVMLLAAVASAQVADKPQAPAKAVAFKALDTPLDMVPPRDPDVIVNSKYVAVIRGIAPPWDRGSFRETLRAFLKRTPKGALPSEEVRKVLQAEGERIRILQHRITGYQKEAARPAPSPQGPVGYVQRPVPVHEIRILAPTSERARELAQAILTAYNVGWAEPERQQALQAKQNEEQRLPKLQEELKAAEKAFQTAQKQIDGYPDIDKEAASALRTRRMLLEVDIEGVRARIREAEKLRRGLAEKPDSQQLAQQVELAKINAQIDQADILARLKKVRQLLDLAERRAKLNTQYVSAQRRLDSAKRNVDRCTRQVAGHAEVAESDRCKPFRVIDNTITIQPIRWTSSAK